MGLGADVSAAGPDKALVRRIFQDLFSEGRLDVADGIFAPDYLDHVVRGPEPVIVRGAEAFKQAVTMFRTAFPNLRYTVDDQIEEDGKVVTRFTARGTHRGPFLGLP
ncbi:MAG: ester cyclase, partial [bacterium]